MNGVWSVLSMAQDRRDRQTVHYDRWTGEEIMRIRFADYHPVQRLASYGISLHEGALFGWANQALGVVAALGGRLISRSEERRFGKEWVRSLSSRWATDDS